MLHIMLAEIFVCVYFLFSIFLENYMPSTKLGAGDIKINKAGSLHSGSLYPEGKVDKQTRSECRQHGCVRGAHGTMGSLGGNI